MDMDNHLKMIEDARKRRHVMAAASATRAVRLREAFARMDWETFNKLMHGEDGDDDAGAEEELAPEVLADQGSGSIGTDPVDPPMPGDE